MKLNKLLPIVAFSGIATVAMPLVTSCSNKNAPEPTGVVQLKNQKTLVISTENTRNYIQSNKFSVRANKQYKVKVTMADWEDIHDMLPYKQWLFCFARINTENPAESQGANVDNISTLNSVKINGTTSLTIGIDFKIEDEGFGFYSINLNGTDPCELDVSSYIEVTMVFKESFNNANFIMMPGI